jgi:proliferating cell nuclear antigen PCNA
MNIQITDPTKCEILTSIFQNMKLFSDSINIMLEHERMFIQSMDSGHVSIIELNIPNTWFNKYTHLNERKNITIGINTITLFKILSTRDKSQNIEINYDLDNSDKISISFTSEDKSVFDKQFSVPLMDLDVDTLSIPEMEYQAEFNLASANFASLMNQLKLFGDTMGIECSEEKIQLSSESLELGKMSVEINIDDLNSFAIDEGEKLDLSFSLNHLYNVAQFHKLSKQIELKFSNNYPMKILYYLGDDNTYISFYIAPKINDNDD